MMRGAVYRHGPGAAGAAYWPINTATTDLKASVLTITERMVSRQEMDWRQARGTEDRARI